MGSGTHDCMSSREVWLLCSKVNGPGPSILPGGRGKTRERWLRVVRPGRGSVPARRAFPSSRTGFVSLQKKPRTPTSATGEDTGSTHGHPTTLPRHTSPPSHTGVNRPQRPCSIPPACKILPPVVRGSQHTPNPNGLGPLNAVEHPLPTQTQQPHSPGDSVKSK